MTNTKMLTVHLSLLVTVLAGASYAQKPSKNSADETDCPGKEVDIAFLVDVTKNPNPHARQHQRFRRRMEFLKAIVSQFDISVNETQVSLVTFAEYPQQEFSFTDYTSRHLVVNAINKVSSRRREGGLNTADAVRFMRVASFFPKNGARPGVPKVAVLLTSGRSRYLPNTIREAKKSRNRNVHLFAMGLDPKVTRSEMDGIVGNASSHFHVNLNSFRSIRRSIHKLKSRICEIQPLLEEERERIAAIAKPEKGCGGVPADVVFLLDASSSIWPVDFRKQLTFVQDIVHVFDISPNRTRVSVVTFDSEPHVEFHLSAFETEERTAESIGKIKQSTGGTNIGKALKFAREEALSQRYSDRESAAKVIILITDGRSYFQDYTALEAARTHAVGIHVFAIGVGTQVDLNELRVVATDPDDKHVFTMDNYDSLESIKVILAIETCKVKSNEPDPLTLRNLAGLDNGCGPHGKADIVFAQALSNRNGAEKTRDFLKDLAADFDIDEGNFRLGLTKTHCEPEDGFSLNAFRSNNEVVKYFNSSNGKRKVADVARAIRDMRVKNFRLSHGARVDVRRIGVILIEGKPEDIELASIEAEKARKMGDIELFVIGIGDEFTDADLKALASQPGDKHIYRVKNFLELQQMKKEIRNMLCTK